MHFKIYRRRAEVRDWCWRLGGGRHGTVAYGEGYASRSDCLDAVNIVRGTSSFTPIIEEPEGVEGP